MVILYSNVLSWICGASLESTTRREATNNMLLLSNYSMKFPLKTFFDLSLGVQIEPLYYSYLYSYSSEEKYCKCDTKCISRRDCCIDRFWDNTHPMSLDSYLSLFLNKSHLHPKTCEYVYSNLTRYKFLCSPSSDEKCCKCDANCFSRKDCCIDNFWINAITEYLDNEANKLTKEFNQNVYK